MPQVSEHAAIRPRNARGPGVGADMTVELGRIGIWRRRDQLTPRLAKDVEALGYGAIWIGGSPPGDLFLAQELLDATTHLAVATGIVNMWATPATEVAASYHRIAAAHPGRFLLGVGIGHPEATAEYRSPYDTIVDYLDVLDAEGVPVEDRVLAALGPKVLALAAERTAGAHPYLTTPAHTRAGPGDPRRRVRCWHPSRRSSSAPTPTPPARWAGRPSTARTCTCATTPPTCGGSAGPTPTSPTAAATP